MWVAAGDVNGDGFADVITGAGAGGGPHVRVFDGRTGAPGLQFFAGGRAFTAAFASRPATSTAIGRADIITAPGPGGDGLVRMFDGVSGAPIGTADRRRRRTPAALFVSTAVPANRMVIDAPANGGDRAADIPR